MKENTTIFITKKKINNLAIECKKPDEAKTFMMAEYNYQLKKVKTEHKLKLLREMNRSEISLTSTEQMCQKLCKRFPNRTRILEEKIRKWKMRDAYKEFNECCQQMNMKRKECNVYLNSEHPSIKFRKSSIIMKGIAKMKSHLNTKNTKKIRFLKEKKRRSNEYKNKIMQQKEREDDIIEGIRIFDRKLNEEYDNKPKCYGGVKIDENEMTTLCLPPKFAMYEEVKEAKCEAEIEKSFAKLRWSRWKDKDGETREYAYDINNKRMNFGNLRPTEMKYNKRVYLPGPMNEKEEIKVLNLKNELMKEVEQYCEENKNKMNMRNLTKKEKKGLKSLKRKSKNELIISQTDKSSKFSVDTKDNYMDAMQVHIQQDEDITENDHSKAQKEANAHSTFWCEMLGISKNTGANDEQKERNHQRAKNNLLVEGNELPPIYGLRKDHKKVNNEEKGPPLRPVCSATNAYNSKIAHLINSFLVNIWKEEEENCASTEELLAEFDKMNIEGIDKDCFIGSADVVALYPSLDIDEVAEVVGEMVKKSDIELEGVNYEETSLYLAIMKDDKQLKDKGIKDLCPTRKQKLGRKPTLTGQAITSDKDRQSIWQPARRKPKKEEKKVLIAEAIKVVLIFIMKNHLYSFANKKKRQGKGGPIGLVLTDATAKIYMTWWDKQVKEEAAREGLDILLYRRYVDDINIVARVNVENSNEEKESENKITEEQKEKRGMEMFQTIGNNISKAIKLEIDHPSNHKERKMPLLDVKVWLQEYEMNAEENGNESKTDNKEERKKQRIMYEHYRKEMASKMTIHARSALPHNQKRNILTQEVIRILKNCSQELPWTTKAQHLEDLSLRMQFSGHDKKMRKEVIKSGIKAFRTMQENDKAGTVPLHRPREWQRKRRERTKRQKKETWYMKGGYETPIFIAATPNGELKKRMQKKIDESDMKIKVIEKTGSTMKRTLHKTSITERTHCADNECMICLTSKKKGLCRKEGVTYEIECKKCADKYIGETGRCANARMKEHMRDYRLKRENSVLWRHCREEHESEKQEFKCNVREIFGSDATLRQITEAVDIKRERARINNKQEWGNFNLPKLGIL
ncbi:MAG: hypothetical protein GY777_02390 [Candidatus Brocadiaceae bacterium]|nr:hypothetical protein [Candidatus Brocadiaceae bacterium]